MAVRSTRLFGGTYITPANAWVTLYTVPAGRTARFSLVTVFIGAAVTWYVGTDAGGADAQLTGGTAGGGTSLELLRGLVLKPGERLRALATVNNVVIVAGFGSLLAGAPL